MNHIALGCIPFCLLATAAFAQDECATAVQIVEGLTSGSNIGATTSSPTGSCGLMGSDIWYYYEACNPGMVTVSLCDQGGSANYDTVLAAFSGSCGSLAELACNDDSCGVSSEITFAATPGETYYIAVGGFGGKKGNFTVSVSCPPPNDECMGALPITEGLTAGTTDLATSSNAPCGSCNDIWYSFVAPCTGRTTASLCSGGGSASYYSQLSAYTGTCGSLSNIACNNFFCSYGSEIDFPTVAGTTYYIAVGGYFCDPIDFTLSITCEVTSNWRTKAAVPAGGIDGAAVGVIGRSIYMSHGYSGFFGYTDALWIYNLKSDSWSSGPSASLPRYRAAGAVADGKYYVLGGQYFSGAVGDVEVFDPATSSWSLGPPMPTARFSMGAAVLDGSIHVIGGRGGNDEPVEVHEVFDPDTGTWSTLAPLPVPVGDNTAMVATGGRIYVLGGWFGGPGGSSLNQIYDPATNSWFIGANMPTPRASAAAGVFDRGIWAGMPVVIGGRHTSFSPLDKVEIYDPATNSWITGPIKPTEASGMGASAVSTGCQIHCIGSSGPSTQHEAMVALEPTATFRNAGSNPASLTITTLPSLGGNLAASVDLTTTGHTNAILLAYLSPDERTLSGGQVLLVDTTNAPLANFPLTSGPIATFSKRIPFLLPLCGLSFSVQAVHINGVVPFALSNAEDIVIGG